MLFQGWKPMYSTNQLYLCYKVEDIERYFDEQVGEDLPKTVADQLFALKTRIASEKSSLNVSM